MVEDGMAAVGVACFVKVRAVVSTLLFRLVIANLFEI